LHSSDEAGGDGVPGIVEGSCRGLSQAGFEFCEDLFDGIEVGRVRRKVEKLGARAFDGAAHAFDAVAGQIVHHRHIAGSERGRAHLFDIGQEALAIHGPIQDQRRGHSIEAQSACERRHSPVAMRHAGPAAFTALTTSAPPRHLGVRARFINEDQPFWLQIELPLEPCFAASCDAGAVLLVGVRRLFLK
jgi:hypothetical protein